jgi:hypothetical protein
MSKQAAPLYINRFITGLYTQRNPLTTPLTYSGLNRIEHTDALIDGLNVEVTEKGTLQRRPGFSRFCSIGFGASEWPLAYYSFRNLSGTITTLVDTQTNVYTFTTSTKTSLYSKGTTAQTSFQPVGSVLYMADGTNFKRWNGTSVYNVGIATPASAPTLSFGAGSLSPTRGFRYVFVYKNSTTGHISTASPGSASTLALTSQNIAVTGTRSTDTQVDKVDIFRTLDGGSIYFYLATINNPPSGSWSYTDSTADSGLNNLISAPVNRVNDPPPAGVTQLAFHMGRMWAATGNKVYFAAGPDCLNGIPEEAWPPANVFVFPGTVTALFSTSQGLLVFMASRTYIIRGLDSGSFFPQLWLSNFGVLNANCITRDADRILVYTANRQLFSIGSELEDIGYAVSNLLTANFNPANSYIVAHRNGSDAGLFVSNGSTSLLRYSLSSDSWSTTCQPVGSGGVGAIGSFETLAGTYTLFAGRASGSGFILSRDLTAFQDDGTSFTAYATIGSLLLAPPGTHLFVDSVLLERMPLGTDLTVSVLMNEVSGTFTALPSPVPEPPELPATTSVIAWRHYLKSAGTMLPQFARHMQVKVSFPTEAFANEVLGLAIMPTTN